ncbi:MAG: aminodeoxychorismate/anthranilate synthase component II [Chitinispirillaceae bacterium]|nr:aminodeoxychorismate/anthranilate synthase component II [Chitinispirillaceae bacterium]
MILMIDNYDSFTFNLVQYLGELTEDRIVVYRNDKISVEEIAKLSPVAILISPGPCTPEEAGISVEVIKKLGSQIPILGVCLGHQSIGVAYGGKVVRAPYLMHGKTSKIYHNGEHIFKNIPSPFTGMRYHSLIIDRSTCPSSLSICAETEDGIIMGVCHKSDPVFGVQFHPESILTENGKTLLKNFLDFSLKYRSAKGK